MSFSRGLSLWLCAFVSSCLLFPPDSQRLLDRAVGKTEQDGFGPGFMGDRIPGRHDEDIVLFPIVAGVADAGAAGSLHHAINGGVRRSMGCSTKTRRQEFNKCCNGRQGISARGRIDVLHFDSVARMKWPAAIEIIEHFSGSGIPVIEDRSGHPRMF